MDRHSLLFVCLGNICRSPLAEGMFAHVVAEAGHGARFHVDSAGTSDWHIGGPPDGRAIHAAAARGIDISGQRARQVAASDFSRFDYVLAMDESNLARLQAVAGPEPGARLHLFLDFADGLSGEIPDPYYGGAEGFEQVLDMVEAASRGLMQRILAGSAG